MQGCNVCKVDGYGKSFHIRKKGVWLDSPFFLCLILAAFKPISTYNYIILVVRFYFYFLVINILLTI